MLKLILSIVSHGETNGNKMKYLILFFALRLGYCVASESVENCTVKDHLPCTLYKSIKDCSPRSLSERFPFIFANDNWPGKVSLFQPNITRELYTPNHQMYPKGIFTFTPPQNSSIKLVKGFIVMRNRSDTDVMCYVFDLSRASWKNGKKDFETVFTLTLFPMKPDVLYVLDFYTLPWSRDSDKRERESLEFQVKNSALRSTTPGATALSKKVIQTDTGVPKDVTGEPGDVNTLTVVLIVMGAVVVLSALFAVWYIRRRAEAGHEYTTNDHIEREVDLDSLVTVEHLKQTGKYVAKCIDENQTLLRRLKVFVLYEEDHRYHRLVVDKFAAFLQLHCQCDVMHALLRDDTIWVHQEYENADFVLIVQSKLAYEFYHRLYTKTHNEWEVTLSGDTKTPGINSILLRCLNESQNGKIVKVYFDYTNEGLVIPLLCSGFNYKMMMHFTDLLMHIHNLKRTDNLAQYDLPLDGQYFLKPAGKDLEIALRKAIIFERENSEWFTQKEGYNRLLSNMSDDSGYASGLPDEAMLPDSNTLQPQSYLKSSKPHGAISIAELSTTSAQLRRYLNTFSKDVITVTPSMIADHDWPRYPEHSPFTINQDNHVSHSQRGAIHDRRTKSADSEEQFDFIPPDNASESETASKTLIEQMTSINARYTRSPGTNQGDYEHHSQRPAIGDRPTKADEFQEQFDCIPPDDKSEFETASKTLSEQMMSINARYIDGSKRNNTRQQELDLLREQSGEIPYIDS